MTMGIFSKLFQTKDDSHELDSESRDVDADSADVQAHEGYAPPGPNVIAPPAGAALGAGSGSTHPAPRSGPPTPGLMNRETNAAQEVAAPAFPSPTAGGATAFDAPPVPDVSDVTAPSFEGLYRFRDRIPTQPRVDLLVQRPSVAAAPGAPSVSTEPPPSARERPAPPPLFNRPSDPQRARGVQSPTISPPSLTKPPAVPRSVASVAPRPAGAPELIGVDTPRAESPVAAGHPPVSAAPGGPEADERQRQRRLEEIVAHAGVVREFICELTLTPLATTWALPCLAETEVLQRVTQELALAEVAEAVSRFADALRETTDAAASVIDGPTRTKLLSAYAALAHSLPDAFGITDYRKRREDVIVNALLGLAGEVQSVSRHRLRAAGICSLERFYGLSAGALAAAAGIDPLACETILAQFVDYRSKRAAAAPTLGLEAHRRRLEGLSDQLFEHEQAFLRADEDEHKPRKRKLRNERAAIIFNIELALVEIGELTLIEELRRMPVNRKIARLQQLVHGLQRRALAS